MAKALSLSEVAPVIGDNSEDTWWRRAVFYQIYPRSFADGNGDGVGDFVGVLSKLDYLQELGIDAIWFSPFYPSPQNDHGYDVANFFDINPEYGTLEQFELLVKELHARNIRVVIDIVPNHSSSEHAWFQEALAAAPDSPERDRYMFRYSEDGAPNNWGSMFGSPAWSKVEELTKNPKDANWWYLHLFDQTQPDFNWENQEVQDMFDDYFRFWCDRGVDGFRVDVAHGLVKEEGLPDDHIGPRRFEWIDPDGDGSMTKAPDEGPYFDQDGVHEIYRHWRTVLDEYGPDRMLVAEAWVADPERLALYVRPDEMSQSFNFEVLKCGWNASELRQTLESTEAANSAVGAVNTWVMSNHDVVRHASRLGYPWGVNSTSGFGPSDPKPDLDLGLQRAVAMTAFLMGLPGSIYVYNGEELGLPDVIDLPDEARTDPIWERSDRRAYGRDGCRVPLPWDSSAKNVGFGDAGDPWLPLPAYWADYAANVQEDDPHSVLAWYRKAIALRKAEGLGLGKLAVLPSDEDVVAVDHGHVVVAMNLGITALEIPAAGKVILTSALNSDEDGQRVEVINGKTMLAPNTAVWIKTGK